MWRFVCVVLLVSSCFADDLDVKENWGKFKSAFKKKFESKKQENLKQAHFEKAVKSILSHNLAADLGEYTYKKGINKFTDMPYEEFASKFLGLKLPENVTRNDAPRSVKRERGVAPASFDWTPKGVVSSVKFQGTCGSCWTFAVSGAMEGAYAIKTGRLVEFSQQQLLDCTGTGGCDGGWVFDAYDYIKKNGIETRSCYPYDGKKYGCMYKSGCVQTKISTYYSSPKNEADVKQDLYDYGPLVICIDANANMVAYSGGIFSDPTCTVKNNHVVLLVGYGTENGKDYWKVKNSWGDDWGESGYFRIARNPSNMCGILDHVSFPVI